MIKLFIFTSILLLGGCASQSYITSNNIQYIEDQRSGLCFAVIYARYSSERIGLTEVNCNDVENLLAQDGPVKNLAKNVQHKTERIEVSPETREYFRYNPFSSF